MVKIGSEGVVGRAAVDGRSSVVQSEGRLAPSRRHRRRLHLGRYRVEAARPEAVAVDGRRALGRADVTQLVFQYHGLTHLRTRRANQRARSLAHRGGYLQPVNL